MVRCVTEIPSIPLEVTPERSHMLLEVLCSSRVRRFARLISEPAEKLRQIFIWPNPVPKRRLVLKRTGKLNSCGRQGSFSWCIVLWVADTSEAVTAPQYPAQPGVSKLEFLSVQV